MNRDVLRKLGLTEGEIKVYEGLISLGKSSTGPIMEKSKISSSKVYLILDKLIQRGLVNYSIENNVKKFEISNPINILEYIEEQKNELDKTQEEATDLVNELNKLIGSEEKEAAKIYTGQKSLRTAFQNILDNLQSDFLFIGAPLEELEALKLFFTNLHSKRVERDIKTRGVGDISTKKRYSKMFEKRENIKLKFIDLQFPHAIAIGEDRIILSFWEPTIVGFEIESKRIAQRYRQMFEELWTK